MKTNSISLTYYSKQIFSARWIAVLLGILILSLIFSQLNPVFLQVKNLQNIIVQAAATGVMAIGMTFVVMTAGIDISVGGILFLTLVIATKLALEFHIESFPMLVYILAIFLGGLMGLLNGLIINYLRINPLITTLATLSVYRGIAIHITQAKIIIPPESARFLGIGKIGSLPVPMLTALLITTIGILIMNYSRFGRYALAIGSSKRSAAETGLPIKRVLVLVYGIAGLCAGVGGMILLGRVGAVQTDMGIGIEFTVITAVVLGGTVLSGGKASMFGSLLGAVFLVMIDNGLNMIRASAFIYDIVRGSVLIGAVVIDRTAQIDLMEKLKSLLGVSDKTV